MWLLFSSFLKQKVSYDYDEFWISFGGGKNQTVKFLKSNCLLLPQWLPECKIHVYCTNKCVLCLPKCTKHIWVYLNEVFIGCPRSEPYSMSSIYLSPLGSLKLKKCLNFTIRYVLACSPQIETNGISSSKSWSLILLNDRHFFMPLRHMSHRVQHRHISQLF